MDDFQKAMQRLTGARTVPSIFVNGAWVGGHDDLLKKTKSGEIAQILGVRISPDIIARLAEEPQNKSNATNTTSTRQARHYHRAIRAVDDNGRDGEGQGEGAVPLDSSNFHQFIASHRSVLVDFYKDGCPACIHMAPKIEKASELLSSSSSATDQQVAIAKVEAHSGVVDDYGHLVQWFPTLVLFRQGQQPTVYSGSTQPEALVEMLSR
uniref:Thioredoxin domain-containing protein n=1 Tax=Lotharella oceanica TaxID=641309 RepID=A0A7S2XG31_9EUKA